VGFLHKGWPVGLDNDWINVNKWTKIKIAQHVALVNRVTISIIEKVRRPVLRQVVKYAQGKGINNIIKITKT